MLGAIIGDIVGSPYEFANIHTTRFPLFSERSSFTDDTICTIAIADALVSGSDFGSKLREWGRRYPNPMGGYGGSFSAWLRSDNPQPYNSLGAMAQRCASLLLRGLLAKKMLFSALRSLLPDAPTTTWRG